MKPIVRHYTVVLSFSAAVMLCVLAAPVGRAAPLQDNEEAQEQELQSLGQIIIAALQGEIIPTGEPFGWTNHYMQGTVATATGSERTTFVAFTLTVEQAKLSTPNVAMYVVVAPKGAPAPETGADAAASTLPTLVFEDAYHISLGTPTEDGAYQISRGFSAQGGDYDVYVALSESGVPDGTEAATMMLKRSVSVPDLWSGELATSSVILLDRVESLSEPLPPEQALANPYTLGTMRLVPKINRAYLDTDDLSVVVLIYNVGTAATGMPDVKVQYTFKTRTPTGDEVFNRTNPLVFNEQTLPQGTDVAAGLLINGGQVVPLASFPAADYRLEIEVTDNTNGASLIRTVDFSVSAS